jgi:hypothetical protein
MPLYKHIRAWPDLPPGSPRKATETMVLEFKGTHDPDSGEQAKDMAALANVFGGVILVGVPENADAFDRLLLPVKDVKSVVRDYENAARDLLAPRPFVEVAVVSCPHRASHAMVAVNVDPHPGQLVGARIPNSEGWRFPIRTAMRHSTYVDPEKAMLYSHAQTRKAAVLLSAIEPGAHIYVHVVESVEGPHGTNSVDEWLTGRFVSLDVASNKVCIEATLSIANQIYPIHAPLEDVEAVWLGQPHWAIRLSGRIRQRLGRPGSGIFYIPGGGARP